MTSSQRNHASSWLRKVAASMQFGIDTYGLSVDLLDRFLSTLKVRPKFLECLAVGCLYIAAKCKEEDDAISITPEFVIDCNANCSFERTFTYGKIDFGKIRLVRRFCYCCRFLTNRKNCLSKTKRRNVFFLFIVVFRSIAAESWFGRRRK